VPMGRKAGVGAAETKTSLLNAAAKVFARRGYDGASIAEITSEAGLTSGAIYAHYESKAELFVATLRAHMERDLDRLLGSRGSAHFLDVLASIGGTFDQPEPTEESLVVAAIVATRTHPDVAALLGQLVAERETIFEDLVRGGQEAGVLAPDVSAKSLSRLSLMIALGSLLASALEMEPLDHSDWERLVARLVGTFKA
jgi:AcrR family transcriptional regulator